MAHRFLSFFSRSILGRLTLLIAAVLGPATLLVGWLIFQGYQNERHALERHLIGAARATSLLVDAALAERLSLLQGLATSSRIRPDMLAQFYQQAKAAVPSADEWIVLIDADGQQLVNTLLPFGTPLPKIAFRTEFKQAAMEGRAYVSNLTLGPASQRHMLFAAIPIRRDQQLHYTLNFAMTPAVFDDALTQAGAAKGWIVGVVDREATLAARNHRAEEFVGVKATADFTSAIAGSSEGILETVTLDGIKSITAYCRSPKWGWTVAVAAPAAELFASAERLLLVALVVSLFLGAGAVLVALWVARGVVSAVRMLVVNTESIGRGEVLGDGNTGIEETDFVFKALAETSSRLGTRDRELKRLNETLTSAARTLRERQERLDAARTAAATGTFVWHMSTGAFESDESLDTLCALPPGEAVRSLEQFVELVDLEDRERVRDALAHSACNGTDLVIEFRIVRHDGVTRWLFSKGRAVVGAERGADYMAAACVDVTDRKEREADIARARDSAVAAARAKDAFLAALSHELRTPLNPVLLAASDAATRPEYPAAARETFEMIARNARLEARLIDDLLDLTRIAQGKLSLDVERVDVHVVLRDAMANVHPEVEEKRHLLNLHLEPAPVYLLADPTRLQQVFWNVLRNAVKFTASYGEVTVSTRVVGGYVETEITDSGIGMTAAEIGRSFQSFSQGDHSTRAGHQFGGLGLGLAIAQKIVELHAGTIEARSRGLGQGSTFVVRLPLAPAQHHVEPARKIAAAATGTSADQGVGRRILLIEDHDPTRVAVERLLKRRGYVVAACGTAAEALQLATVAKFDLVLSDIGLPDTDGYTLMQQLGERHGLRGVALSGYGMDEDIERSRKAGFAEHLTKPIDVQKLDAVLARMQGANAAPMNGG